MIKNKNIKYSPLLISIFEKAKKNPDQFWGDIASELHWFKRWDKVFEWNYPLFNWFSGGIINISYNCLENQINQGIGDKQALIWESGEGRSSRSFTYHELYLEVKKFASALKALGVKKGDIVTIYMPNIPEAAIAMLACARIGAIHSVVFAGFGYEALNERIINAESKFILTADVNYRRGKVIRLKDIVDVALRKAKVVEKVVVLRRTMKEDLPMIKNRDILWEDALRLGEGIKTEVEKMNSNELLFLIYTSGTTAKPKGTVQPHGGYQVYIYAMGKWIYGMNENDVWWPTTDIGWVVGQSYGVYAPLLFGCTAIMYEGVPDYPKPDIWWEITEKNKVTKIWTSPTAIRALMKYGIEWPLKHNLNSLEVIFSAGEVLNPAAWEWLQKKVLKDKVPVIDHMWQTESSGPIVANPYGLGLLPIKPGSSAIPVPGIDADIVDDNGKPVPVGVEGNFVCLKPFPGLTPTLWKDEKRYVESYWNKIPGVYYTGDAGSKDEDGYIFFVGRRDEVIKIASHRVGTIEIESVVVSHPAVAEAAVVGIPDQLKGEVACAFIILKEGYTPDEKIKKELRKLIRDQLGPIIIVKDFLFLSKIPKTRSGKIMRRLIRAIVEKKPLGDYSTIEDQSSITEIKEVIKSIEV